MDISIIVAMSENRVIGVDNRLPWHLPADLQHFKSITLGKPIVMGRKTYESIGRPLPGRTNIVVTRDPDFRPDQVVVADSLQAALDAAAGADEVMVIGGASLYAQMLPKASRLYLTVVHQVIEGDAFFPDLNDSDWKTVDARRCEPDQKNPLRYSFLTLQRTNPTASTPR